MRLLITGSRDWTGKTLISDDLQGWPEGTVIVHGGCLTGADAMADDLAQSYGYEVIVFFADWDNDGKAAGPIRNSRMLNEGGPFDLCLAYPLPQSKGTVDMMKKCQAAGIKVMTPDTYRGSMLKAYRVLSSKYGPKDFASSAEAIAHLAKLDCPGCLYGPGPMTGALMTKGAWGNN